MSDIAKTLINMATLADVNGEKVRARKLREAAVVIEDLDVSLMKSQRRVRTLEDRLEVYSTPDAQGKRLYLDIGDCDGIGCRDETIKLLDKRIESLEGKVTRLEAALDKAWADRSAWESSANSYKEEACRLKLVAGRYQFMWEKSQLCINNIDDHFEYAHKGRTPDQLQAEVRKHLATYTEAISKSKAQIGK